MGKQKEVKNSDQILVELYVSAYKYLHSSTLTTISFYENQYKLYENLIASHIELEPLKIFKKSHKQWQNELDNLTKYYNNAWDSFLEECEELVELEKLVNMS